MEKILLIALAITLLFCVMKFIEMKFIDKQLKPLKFVIRDAVIVYVCSAIGLVAYANIGGSLADFMNVVTDKKTLTPAATQIFTDEPGF
jgi:hypothetical protein